eukprot:1981779-Lingulodinium_polyedra.AAC.1
MAQLSQCLTRRSLSGSCCALLNGNDLVHRVPFFTEAEALCWQVRQQRPCQEPLPSGFGTN